MMHLNTEDTIDAYQYTGRNKYKRQSSGNEERLSSVIEVVGIHIENEMTLQIQQDAYPIQNHYYNTNPDTLLEIRKSHLFHAVKHHKISRNCADKPIQRIQAPAQPIAPLSRHPIEKPGESTCQQDKNKGKNGSIKKLLLKCHVAPFPVIHNYEHNQGRKDIEFHI